MRKRWERRCFAPLADDGFDDNEDDRRASRHRHLRDHQTRFVPGRKIGLCLPITGSFHPLRIRHAVHIECSEPSKLVQFVQPDQHKRLGTDFASASHAEGRWFETSRDHHQSLV